MHRSCGCAVRSRRRRALGGALYIFNMKDELLAMLRGCGAFDEIGDGNVFKQGDDVIGTLYRRLDAGVFRTCTARIFRACVGDFSAVQDSREGRLKS